MNNIQIKTKLIILAFTVIFLVIALAVVMVNLFNQNHDLNQAQLLTQNARSSMLTLRRNEKDFLARNKLKYQQKFHQNKGQLTGTLKTLRELLGTYKLSNIEDMDKLDEYIQNYTASFDSIITLQQKIGLDHQKGLRGQLRKAVHDAEDQLKTLNLTQQTADMLMLRRNEKDFIIRKNLKYLDKYNKNFDILISNFTQLNIENSTREKILQDMQNYKKGFHELVSSYQQKGLDQNKGLQGKMREAIHQTETIFDQIEKDLVVKITHHNQSAMYQTTIFVVIMGFLIIGMFLLLIRNILQRLAIFGQLDAFVKDNQVDLTLKLDQSGKDELSTISQKFNFFISDLKKLIGNLPELSQTLKTEAESNTTIADETNNLAISQKAQSEEIAAAVEQLIIASREINQNIHSAATSAEQAKNDATSGKQKIATATTSMSSLSSNMQQSTEITSELEVNSNDISQVLDVIRSIAEQTNLLALNAAIEAARAGENGRGFAVVADEVRTLAQRTQDSTEEIQKLIEKLHTGVTNTVSITQKSNEYAASGVSAMNEAISSFDQITDIVNQIFNLNTSIATASEQQSAASENILSNISQVSTSAQQTTLHSSKVMQSGEEFVTISNELTDLISHYKL